MQVFEIQGGNTLSGEIEVRGSKNAAAPIIAALATSGTSIIEKIEQVDRGYEKIEERLQKVGAHIVRKGVV